MHDMIHVLFTNHNLSSRIWEFVVSLVRFFYVRFFLVPYTGSFCVCLVGVGGDLMI